MFSFKPFRVGALTFRSMILSELTFALGMGSGSRSMLLHVASCHPSPIVGKTILSCWITSFFFSSSYSVKFALIKERFTQNSTPRS